MSEYGKCSRDVEGEGERLTSSGVADDELVVLYGDRGNANDGDRISRVLLLLLVGRGT